MSKLIKHVREAPNFFYSFSVFFMYCLVSVSLWLSHIHYVYKFPYYSLQQVFVIHPLVIFVHYSPLMVGLCSPKQFLAVVEIFRLFIIHNSLSNRSPSSLSLFASKGLIPFFLLQSAKVLIVRYNPYYISCYSSQVVRFCVTLNVYMYCNTHEK